VAQTSVRVELHFNLGRGLASAQLFEGVAKYFLKVVLSLGHKKKEYYTDRVHPILGWVCLGRQILCQPAS